MKKTLVIIIIFFLYFSPLISASTEEELLKEAKLLIFDRKWKEAQIKLEDFINKYPKSNFYADALFYLGKSLQEQKNKEEEAINVYEKFLYLKKAPSLQEEAEISIIDLSQNLYLRGKKHYLKKIEDRLKYRDKVTRYYAAFKISYLKDNNSRKAIPVLKEILNYEKDEELKERAKLALLRIDPNSLRGFTERTSESWGKTLKIRIYKKGKVEPEVSVNIPFPLAELALKAVAKENTKINGKIDGKEIKIKDIDEFLKKVYEMKKMEILEIYSEDEIIKIWIE
ncbi:MAG: tetratricopeptide repeat protein [Acidobacteriota bacterium]